MTHLFSWWLRRPPAVVTEQVVATLYLRAGRLVLRVRHGA
jgi:hypothetical protein